MLIDDVTRGVIGAAIAVHRELGPGLLESSYEACLGYELGERGFRFQKQRALGVTYRGVYLDCSYRMDLVVENQVVVEVKSVARIEPVHLAQMLTYLKFSRCTVGLILNFNVPLLKQGIQRVVLHHTDAAADPDAPPHQESGPWKGPSPRKEGRPREHRSP